MLLSKSALRYRHLALALATAYPLLATGCGSTTTANLNGGLPNVEINDAAPADSTGKTANVTFSFAADNSAATGLNLATDGSTSTTSSSGTSTTSTSTSSSAATSIVVSDAINLSMARFNIAAIRVKAAKAPSADEDKLEAAEKQQDEKDADDIEKASQPSDTEVKAAAQAALAGDQASSQQNLPASSMLQAMAHARHLKVAAQQAVFEAKDKAEDASEAAHDRGIKDLGSYVYDAVANKFEGSAPKLSLPDGTYKRIEFMLKRNWTEKSPDPLLGNVFVLQGTFKNKDGKTISFEVSSGVAENIRLAGDAGAKLQADQANELEVVFDVAKWFDGIDLSKASIDASSGSIIIDHNTNQDILHALLKNMKKDTRFGKPDADHKVQPAAAAGSGDADPDVNA